MNAVPMIRRMPERAEMVEFVSFTIADQLFGLPILKVQDVLGPHAIARVPLAPPEIAGSLNLRGRIVTVVDMRRRLGLDGVADPSKCMSIVVERGGEAYSLIVDAIGEVLSVNDGTFERNPTTLDPRWRELSQGIYRLQGNLLLVLDLDRLLDFPSAAQAA
jgi:purine-binding chemotaxis protein CheW